MICAEFGSSYAWAMKFNSIYAALWCSRAVYSHTYLLGAEGSVPEGRACLTWGRMQPTSDGQALGCAFSASPMIGVYARIPGVPYGSGGGGQ